MKLIFIVAMLVASPQLTAKQWQDGVFFAPYVGFDVEYAKADYDESDGIGYLFDDQFTNYKFHIGGRVHRHWGVEFGYSKSNTQKKSSVVSGGGGGPVNVSTKIDYEIWSLDVLGYVPVSEQFEFIVAPGVGRISEGGSFRGGGSTARASGNAVGWRGAAGFQYWLSDHINARVMARYQAYSGDVDTDLKSIGAGINFSF